MVVIPASYKYIEATYGVSADKSSDKPLGWDAMKRRNEVRQAAVLNAQAIEWVKTHTLQDLEDLVGEMSGLGEDVTDIADLLDDLKEIGRSLNPETEPAVPEECEYAAIAG